MEPIKKRKIRNQLILILLIVTVLPLLIFGYLNIEANRDNLRDYERLQQTNLAERMRVEIENYMNNNFSSLESLSLNISVQIEASRGNETLTDSAKQIMLSDYLQKAIHVLFVSIRDARRNRTINAGERNFNLNKESEIIKAAEEGLELIQQKDGYLSSVIKSISLNQPVVLYMVPIKRGQEVIGHLSSIIGLTSLNRLILERSGENYEIFLVDTKSTIIGKANIGYIRSSDDLSKIPIVKEFISKAGSSTWPGFSINQLYEVRTESSVENYLGTFTPIEELGWGLFVQLKTSIAFRPVQQMIERTLIMLLIAGAASFIVGIFFANTISKPLRTLTEITNTIAEGKFDQNIAVNSRNEIGVLADRFNFMSEELQKMIISLQQSAQTNKELFINSIKMISAAVDEKDPYTRGHSEKVREYSVEIARVMGLSKDEIEKVAIAAILHDVGKIGIDDSVLRKPGTLSPEEYEIMKQHCQKGAYIMSPIRELREIIPGILYHHEKYDGTGYPEGLVSDQIPVVARIIAVADTFDAMTSDRPYQKAMEVNYVFKLLFDWAGKRFDSNVVASLFQAHEQGRIQLSKSRSSILT